MENSLPKDKKGLAKKPQQCEQARENSLLQEQPTEKQQFLCVFLFLLGIFFLCYFQICSKSSVLHRSFMLDLLW